MCGILAETAPKARVAALSGTRPSRWKSPAACPPRLSAACGDPAVANLAQQQLFHRPAFRVYTSTDVLGVELGGALKNVIAIAAECL